MTSENQNLPIGGTKRIVKCQCCRSTTDLIKHQTQDGVVRDFCINCDDNCLVGYRPIFKHQGGAS